MPINILTDGRGVRRFRYRTVSVHTLSVHVFSVQPLSVHTKYRYSQLRYINVNFGRSVFGTKVLTNRSQETALFEGDFAVAVVLTFIMCTPMEQARDALSSFKRPQLRKPGRLFTLIRSLTDRR